MDGNGQAPKKTHRHPNRTAERPEQTANIDLCFVPIEHAPKVKLPAVSGSSGRLVVERGSAKTQPPDWPGTVFTLPELSYEAAMQHYLAATCERLGYAKGEKAVATGHRAAKQALRRAEEALREERYQVRERRKQEDAAWRALRK